MKKSLLGIAAFVLGISFSNISKAQLADGSVAPNFTSTDITGASWDLYTVLNQGKTVIIDISATWCGPCWNYHSSGALDQVMQQHGPTGMTGVNSSTTNDMMVFFVEGDASTNTACLYGPTGCNSSTQGDWVTGTLSPILDDASIANSYQITYFPSIFMICPDKICRLAGQLTCNQLYAMKQQYCYSATSPNDAGLNNSVGQMLLSCDSVAPALKLSNYGTAPLTSCTITYSVDGTPQKVYNWTGNLATYGIVGVTGPKVGAAVGTHTITATVSNPNGGADAQPANDNATGLITFNIVSSTGGPTITEGFQGTSFPPAGWLIENGGLQNVTWQGANVGGFGTSTQSTTLRFYDAAPGDVDALILSSQSFVGQTSATMTFDVAKAKYSASYPDRLKVKVSSNCGATWTTVYNKSDATGLVTVGAATTTDFSPTSAQWRTETVNLNAFAGKPNVLVMFEGTASPGGGNNLYVDNVNIALSTAGIKEMNTISDVNMYPNPASSELALEISMATSENVVVSIYNGLGELVYNENRNNLPVGDSRILIGTENLANGMYTLTVSSIHGFVSKKLAINK